MSYYYKLANLQHYRFRCHFNSDACKMHGALYSRQRAQDSHL